MGAFTGASIENEAGKEVKRNPFKIKVIYFVLVRLQGKSQSFPNQRRNQLEFMLNQQQILLERDISPTIDSDQFKTRKDEEGTKKT